MNPWEELSQRSRSYIAFAENRNFLRFLRTSFCLHLCCLSFRYNEDIAMVGCDGQCGNWFHFGCVGLKPDIDGGVSDAFYCPMCKPLQEQKNKNSAS